MVNAAKSKPISQIPRYLGLNLDTVNLRFLVPDDKIGAFFDRVASADFSNITKRKLASILGFLMSFARALGPIVRMKTRSLYSCLGTDLVPWDQTIGVSKVALSEIEFWKENLVHLNGFPFRKPDLSVNPTFTKAGDASGEGFYLPLVSGSGETLLSRAFSLEERGKSSTWTVRIIGINWGLE